MKRETLPIYFVTVGLLALLALLGYSYFTEGIVAMLLRADLDAAAKVESLRRFFDAFGAGAPLAYVLLVMLEVVIAPLPGAMLYAPGGAIFGGFWGGLLSLIGNVLGAALAAYVARLLGHQLMQRMEDHATLSQLQNRLGVAQK